MIGVGRWGCPAFNLAGWGGGDAPAFDLSSAAAGGVAAARARVAGAGALHHAAALVAGRAEVEADHAGRDDRGCVRERDRRGLGRRGRDELRAAVAVAAVGWAGRATRGAGQGVLGDLL